MTEQEMRELVDWLAVDALGWKRLEDSAPLVWEMQTGEIRTIEETSFRMFYPVRDSKSFSEIKREIERRGWSWYASWNPRHENQQHYFSVDSGGAPDKKPYSYSVIHTEMAETEELAGCLAFKAAVEATNDNSVI